MATVAELVKALNQRSEDHGFDSWMNLSVGDLGKFMSTASSYQRSKTKYGTVKTVIAMSGDQVMPLHTKEVKHGTVMALPVDQSVLCANEHVI